MQVAMTARWSLDLNVILTRELDRMHVRALGFIFGVFITRRDNIIMLLRFLAAAAVAPVTWYYVSPETAKPHR